MKNVEDIYKSGLSLEAACPFLFSRLLEQFSVLDIKIADQLKKTFLIKQIITGGENDFSFMAYPVPRLTKEELRDAEFCDEISLNVKIESGEVKICFDNFGRINWFYIKNLPDIFKILSKSMQDI